MLLSSETLLGLRITGAIRKSTGHLGVVSSAVFASLIFIHYLSTYYLCHYTANSFIDLLEYIFTLPDVKVFLSQRICQDPLETFLGCQQQRGGTHNNLNVQEFQKNMQALRVINCFAKGQRRGIAEVSVVIMLKLICVKQFDLNLKCIALLIMYSDLVMIECSKSI